MNRLLFTSHDCGACKIVKKKLAEKNIFVNEVYIDTDEGAQKAARLGVCSLPTLIELVEGVPVRTLLGSTIAERI